ncbi:MAG: NUDIX hydrolase [Waddliaceae bacterium]
MSSDISYKTGEGTFNYRVGGVALHNGKVLLVTDERFNFWFPPGGKATLLEPSDKTLQREVFEELGVSPTIERVLWTTESMFYLEYWKGNVHEMTILYLISFPKEASIYSLESGTGDEEVDGKTISLKFRWFDIDKLVNMIPPFLKKALKNIPPHPEHFIINELEKQPARKS